MGSRAHMTTSAAYRNGHDWWSERRDLALVDAGVEVRTDAAGQPRFYGHAAVFNVRTAIGNPLTWGFYEQVAAGAFTKTIQETDQRFLIDHDSYYIVARRSAGTLSHYQDGRGLITDAALDSNLSYVNDLTANLRNGNTTGMSFGFRVIDDEWTEIPVMGANGEPMVDPDGNSVNAELRTILEVQCFETSAVTFPAYEETDAGLRHSLIPALRRRDDRAAIERTLRYRPELRSELIPATVIDLKASLDAQPVGEILGNEVPIAPTGLQLQPLESSGSEPAETTRTPEQQSPTETPEPVASTQHAPSQHDLAKARLRALSASLT